MSGPRRRVRPKAAAEISPAVLLWMLRILIPLGGYRAFVMSHGFCNDSIAVAIGMEAWVDLEDREYDEQAVRAEMRKRHQEYERATGNVAMPACLISNVNRLSKLVGLSEVDCRVLEFSVLINNDRALDDVADWLGHISSMKTFQILSVLLDLPESDIRDSLSGSGVLARSGLVSMNRHGAHTLRGKLELLSDDFADHILSSDADPISLLRNTVSLSAAPELSLADFKHIAPSLAVLRPYLRRSISAGRKGVNVFVHGDPGTGKSQLTRVLAKELGCELFEVACEDSDGDPVSGERRLRAFRAAQSFFSQRKALVLFDEVEDVFNDGDDVFGRKSTAQKRKAWINRMLEENSVPTLWLSNSIGGLDPAFVRRFDMVVELPVPPKKQRLHIIEEACSDLLDASSMARISESESLAPAVVTRAASVVRLIRQDLDDSGASSAMALLIDSTLEAQGHKGILLNDSTRLPEIYDPVFIQADCNLAKVAVGLMGSKSGRLCLYGPPGTGKTAYGQWLAEQLDVPLVTRRASDFLSKWLGETERNIARAFKQAAQEGALLLIDEVDSFLQDRRGAQHSWEVSHVNEMLTQMESFPGVFVASTNLMVGLDQAALRRFDLKVKFGFLRGEQVTELFSRCCKQLNLPGPQTLDMTQLERLQKLTPGDFASVIRQSKFRSFECSAALIDALHSECAMKEGTSKTIGFLS